MTESIQELQTALVAFLQAHGLTAVTAWSEERRLRPGQAVAAVALRALECAQPGFQDYLGERYNESTGAWEELYGRKAGLTFGVDLYGATAETVRAGVNALSLALSREGPEGLRPVELHVGETVYQENARRYMCPAQVKFTAWLAAVTGEEGSFLDFEVKGEQK